MMGILPVPRTCRRALAKPMRVSATGGRLGKRLLTISRSLCGYVKKQRGTGDVGDEGGKTWTWTGMKSASATASQPLAQ